jgi:Family of unknown function (DUF6349)
MSMGMEPLFDLEQMAADAARDAAQARLPAWWATLPDGPSRPGLLAGKCMYDAPVAGLAPRTAVYAMWRDVYGGFGSGIWSHCWAPAWLISLHLDGYQLDRHEATTLACDLRREWLHREKQYSPVPPCGHDADAETRKGFQGLHYRGVCRLAGCDWEGPDRDRENPAVEDAIDHAHPGWRTLPPVPKTPERNDGNKAKRAAREKWIVQVTAAYPDGWLEAGGPIRTVRGQYASRHVEAATPYGGYDMALTCHLCGATEGLTWLTGAGVTVAGCEGGCPGKED